jgi:hypothetical protein
MTNGTSFIPPAKSKRYFGSDSPWFESNIPMFECSDGLLEEIYHYRWKSYKAHIRDIGKLGTVITEFLDDVGWQKHPYAMLNDATGFHIYEGRWIRDRQYLDGFIEFLYPGGGNDRHFAESIADAAYAYFLVHGDVKFATKHLPAMKHIYNLWDDHFDFGKGLYFIEPLLDATEYTVSSIDASAGKDGFRGGDAFRPTINSYMYANAMAISHLSELAGDSEGAKDYADRAKKLKATIQTSLWNQQHQHFMDRYKVNNSSVKYWDFIRARELAGYVPWTHNLPDDEPKYSAAWMQITNVSEFAGPHGLRTIGPSFEYYMKQYRYLGTAPECQWNGPSWPFQTTQVLLGMANLINNYQYSEVSPRDYIDVLRQYAHQHYLDGKPNLQEDYNPDTGRPIVGLDRSHHYNHSGFVDLIITGLCGLRPSADETLVVNPIGLREGNIHSFCLENVPYRGNLVTIVWDDDGKKYGKGAGLSVYVNGALSIGPAGFGRVTCPINPRKTKASTKLIDRALNIYRTGHPVPSASTDPENTIWQAVDGRAWYFPEMVRGWAPDAKETESWFEVAFDEATDIRSVAFSFYADGEVTHVPDSIEIQAMDTHWWTTIYRSKEPPVANTEIRVNLKAISTNRLRIVIGHSGAVRLVSFTCF